jgi:hypothetical protein
LIDKEYQKPKNLKEIKSANKRKELFSGKFEHKSGKKTFSGNKTFLRLFVVRFLKEGFCSGFFA